MKKQRVVSKDGPYQPPMIYDPKQGKIVRPGGDRALMKELRQLFDKTTAALSCSSVDYKERVERALLAVYAYGRRSKK